MSSEEPQELAAGTGGMSETAKTSDFYRTDNIPNRFEHPDWFQGYGGKKQHPMYRTTAATYGSKSPSVHTMPTSFHCRSQKFSEVVIWPRVHKTFEDQDQAQKCYPQFIWELVACIETILLTPEVIKAKYNMDILIEK